MFPIGLRLDARPCLVVGSGGEVERRATALTEAGAVVRVVSAEHFEETDLDGQWLAVLTDRDRELAARIARGAEERRLFFCAVDEPDFCSFTHLALARSGSLTIAISTNGRAPSLARRLREEIARLFAESKVDRFVERLAALRDATPPGERRNVLGDAVRAVRIEGRLELPELDASERSD